MDERYYYLLDGTEQGPFSRAAMESLLVSGGLTGALIRPGSDATWQVPSELGFQEPTEARSAINAARSDRDIYGLPIKSHVIQDGRATHSSGGAEIGASIAASSNTSEIDLSILKKSDQHLESYCLECGYEGRFPVLSKTPPWYGKFWGYGLIWACAFLFFGPIGFAGGLMLAVLLAVLASANAKCDLQCPRCTRHLTING